MKLFMLEHSAVGYDIWRRINGDMMRLVTPTSDNIILFDSELIERHVHIIIRSSGIRG